MGWFDWLKPAPAASGPVQVGGSLGGTPRLVKVGIKTPAKQQTAADKLDWLCSKYKGTYDRVVRSGGLIVIRFYQDNGDTVVSGSGANSMEAVQALAAKLEAKP